MGELIDDLAQLAQLHAAGALTDEEFQTAKAARLQKELGLTQAGSSSSDPAWASHQRLCPICSNPYPSGARHCNSCGTALVEVCPLCEKDNALDAKFCVHCGIEQATLLPGLTLTRARQWREQFSAMGWLDGRSSASFGPERQDRIRELFAQQVPPLDPDGPADVWVFLCPIVDRPWQVSDVWVNDQHVQGGAWFIGTRARLALLNLHTLHLQTWLYRDIASADFQHGRASMLLRDRSKFSFRIKTKGSRLLDHAATMFHNDEVQHLIAAQNISDARARKAEFLDVIRIFIEEIADYGDPGAPSFDNTGKAIDNTGEAIMVVQCLRCHTTSQASYGRCEHCKGVLGRYRMESGKLIFEEMLPRSNPE